MNDNNRRWFQWPILVSTFCSILALALIFPALWRMNSLEKRTELRLREIDYRMRVGSERPLVAEIEPTVGTIQFIRRGFSIELGSVSYTSEGLQLTGFVGNPTNLTVHGLSLTFTASSRMLSATHDEFVKKPPSDTAEEWFFIPSHPEIGHAQSAPTPLLLPGTRAPFSVAVPNVKQSTEGFRLEVAFSGAERYSY